jgi:hypothetical protein
MAVLFKYSNYRETVYQNSILTNIWNCAHNTLSTNQWKKRWNCGEYLWRLCKLSYFLKIMHQFWTYQQRTSYKTAYNFIICIWNCTWFSNSKRFNYCLYKTTETKLLFCTVQTVMGSKVLTLSSTFCHLCICVCLLTCHMYTTITFVQTGLFLSNFACFILMKAAYQHNNYFFPTVTYNTSILAMPNSKFGWTQVSLNIWTCFLEYDV